MGKISVNKAIDKIVGESPANGEAVKELLSLVKGKIVGNIGNNAECHKNGCADESPKEASSSVNDFSKKNIQRALFSTKVLII